MCNLQSLVTGSNSGNPDHQKLQICNMFDPKMASETISEHVLCVHCCMLHPWLLLL